MLGHLTRIILDFFMAELLQRSCRDPLPQNGQRNFGQLMLKRIGQRQSVLINFLGMRVADHEGQPSIPDRRQQITARQHPADGSDDGIGVRKTFQGRCQVLRGKAGVGKNMKHPLYGCISVPVHDLGLRGHRRFDNAGTGAYLGFGGQHLFFDLKVHEDIEPPQDILGCFYFRQGLSIKNDVARNAGEVNIAFQYPMTMQEGDAGMQPVEGFMQFEKSQIVELKVRL